MKHICHHECECHPQKWYLGFIRVQKMDPAIALMSPTFARMHTHRIGSLKGKVDHGIVFQAFGYAIAVTPIRTNEQ